MDAIKPISRVPFISPNNNERPFLTTAVPRFTASPTSTAAVAGVLPPHLQSSSSPSAIYAWSSWMAPRTSQRDENCSTFCAVGVCLGVSAGTAACLQEAAEGWG
jgi:hypothetical protein